MNKKFWNSEYNVAKHLALSIEPSEDFEKFVRWSSKNAQWPPFPKGGVVLDIGCGNGRNIIALCKEAQMKGIGIDISGVALSQARTLTKNLPIKFIEQNISKPFALPDGSVDVVIDSMVSHVLYKEEREALLKEIVRVMKPYGWLFFKSFILDGDVHAKRLIKDYPTNEENTYIHPKIKVAEHVWTEEELFQFFSPYFKIHKMMKSYKHVLDGKPHKRRTISLYLEKLRE